MYSRPPVRPSPADRPPADRHPTWISIDNFNFVQEREMLNVECWMVNLNVEMLNVEGWNTTFQHFNIVKRSTFQCWQHLRFFGSESNIQHWKKNMLTTLSTFVQIYTTLDVENLNMLQCWKCWKVEMLRNSKVEMLKCWGL